MSLKRWLLSIKLNKMDKNSKPTVKGLLREFRVWLKGGEFPAFNRWIQNYILQNWVYILGIELLIGLTLYVVEKLILNG